MLRTLFYVLLITLFPLPAFAACTGPAGDAGDILYNEDYDVLQWCDGLEWIGFKKPPSNVGPPGCPNVGNTCDDGTIYAGDSLDGGDPMYTTDVDQSSGAYWGTYNFQTGSMSYVTGAANTADVYAHVQAGDGDANPDDGYTPNAFVLCAELSAHGHDDWYLPARDELAILYTNKNAGNLDGTFDESGSLPGGYYWSSSEYYYGSLYAVLRSFDGGGSYYAGKNTEASVRCVRREEISLDLGSCMSPTGNAGDIIYNSDHTVLQWCDGTYWVGLPKRIGGGPDCRDIGDTCDDGTIYAGDTPDGGDPMYTTPADAPSLLSWNDGTSNYTDTAMTNCTDFTPGLQASCQTGEANTAFLVGATGEPDYPFAAAEYCDGLSAHGHDDWYLPAQDELDVLYTNKNAGDLDGTFDETGFPDGSYWSSSEFSDDDARNHRFSDDNQMIYYKSGDIAVRCVRKGDPSGGGGSLCDGAGDDPGDILYNEDYDVLQWCDGTNWIGLPK